MPALPDGIEYHLGFEFRFGCLLDDLSPSVRAVFRRSSMDRHARDFVEARFAQPHGVWLTRLHRALRTFASDFDVNAWLGAYPLYLLSTPEWRRLLPALPPDATLLDVGAGNGDLTQCLAPLFARVVTTERSRGMARRLRARGFPCVAHDRADAAELAERYDVVSCLNVIDRTQRPLSLLASMAQRVRVGGCFVLSVPLPLEPFYYRGPATLSPAEPLGIEGGSWESQCSALAERFVASLPDFELRAVTRCPYISGGDASQRLYVLDDAIWVFQRTGASASALSE